MKLTLLFFAMLPTITFASDATEGKITNILKGQKKAVVEWTGSPPSVESSVIFTSEKKESCEGTVATRTNKTTMVALGDCDIISDLKVGMAVSTLGAKAIEKKEVEKTEEKPSESSTVNKKLRFGIGAFLSTANKLRFDSMKFRSGGAEYTGNASYSTDNVLGLQGEISTMEQESWGFNGGVTIEGKRNLSSYEVSIGGASGAGSTTGGIALNVVTLYGNALYRWEKVYLPFGLNISVPSVENPSAALQNLRGGLGVQVGVGYMFNENFTAYTEVRALSFSGPANSYGTSTIELGTGFLTGFNIGVKGFFF